MEGITISVLLVVLFLLCIVFYVFYKRYKASTVLQTPVAIILQSKENKLDTKKVKRNAKKEKPKKESFKPKKKPIVAVDEDSDTESYTTEQQLAQTIISQHLFSQDSINTTAVNAKPTVKKLTAKQRSNSRTRSGVSNSEVVERDPDWENVISRKKKKLYPVSKHGETFEFTLDGEGGIVDIPSCEIAFPAESVTKPLRVSVDIEKYKKLVDDVEEKVFVTHVARLSAAHSEDTKLRRHFTMKLNTKRLMGKGWNGNVSCQIETKDTDDEWVTTGRTEYVFGKPVQFTGDELSSFRVVITKGQNGAISRDLQIAAYIAKPKIPNPTHHFVHLCIYDGSQQSQYKVDSNMQNLLIKMQPRQCNIPFGSDVEFKIQPTQKFSPDDKVVFMRWTEVCKAFVNVRFQIRLDRNESEDPNFEAEFRTMVFLEVLKIRNSVTVTQGEYFHFYWISATLYPKNQKFKGKNKKEEDSNFTSTSNVAKAVIKPSQTVNVPGKSSISPQRSETSKKSRKKKTMKKTDEASGTDTSPKATALIDNVQSSQAKNASSQRNSKLLGVKHGGPASDNKSNTVDGKMKSSSQENGMLQSSKVQSSTPFFSSPSPARYRQAKGTDKSRVSSKNEKTFNLSQFVPVKTQEFLGKGGNLPVSKATVNGLQSAPNTTAISGVHRQRKPLSKSHNRSNDYGPNVQDVEKIQPFVTKHALQMSDGGTGDRTSLKMKKREVFQPQAGGDGKAYPQPRNEKRMHDRPKVMQQQSQSAHQRSQGKPDRPEVVHQQLRDARDRSEVVHQQDRDTHQELRFKHERSKAMHQQSQVTLDHLSRNGSIHPQKEPRRRPPRSNPKYQQTISKPIPNVHLDASHTSSNFTQPELASESRVPQQNGQRHENHLPTDKPGTNLSNGSLPAAADEPNLLDQIPKFKRQRIRNRRRGPPSSSGTNAADTS